LRLGLHALGADLDAKLMRQADSGTEHGGVAIIDSHVEHEFLGERPITW
jgi:hypothetical protein